MREDAFQQQYEEMTDDQLEQVLADKKDLLPEAASALDREVQRRQLRPSSPPKWISEPDSEDPIHSLDEVLGYRSLQRTKKFLDRFWYWIAFGPVAVVLVSAKYAYRNPENLKASVGWVTLTIGYWLFVKLRISAYTCPRCAQRFGPGPTCFYCGFRRTSTREQ